MGKIKKNNIFGQNILTLKENVVNLYDFFNGICFVNFKNMKKIIICLAVICLLLSGCKNCQNGGIIVNLPALDWEVYHDVKTLFPYGCNYNDTSFSNQLVKLTGWFVISQKTDRFMLCDDEKATTDYYFKPSVGLEIDGYYSDFDAQIRQLIDSVDVTQKCYVIGKLVCKMLNQGFIGSCNEYIPVLIVNDIKNISFGKEVENE